MLRFALLTSGLLVASTVAASPCPSPIHSPTNNPLSIPPAEPSHWDVAVTYIADEGEPGQVYSRVRIWVRTSPAGPPEEIGAWDADGYEGALRLLLPAAMRRAEGVEE